MAHSPEKLREIEKRIEFALERPSLNKWSRSFLRDMRVRIAKYGKNVRFSEKQAKILSSLIDFDLAADRGFGPWNREQVRAFGRRPRPLSVAASNPKSRWPTSSDIRLVLPAILGLVCIGVAYAALTFLDPTYEPLSALNVRVIDGDTIGIAGEPQNVRLVGFNAPETSDPICSQERAIGAAATDRLKGLVATDELDFAYVRCACDPATLVARAARFVLAEKTLVRFLSQRASQFCSGAAGPHARRCHDHGAARRPRS